MSKKRWRRILQFITIFLLIFMVMFGMEDSVKAKETDNPVKITTCKLTSGGKKLTVKAKVSKKTKSMGKKLYLLNLNAYITESGKKSVKPLKSVKTKQGTIIFQINYKKSMLYQKFVVAYKSGGKYKIISDARYITNPEILATYKGKGPIVSSKKGLQVEELSDSLEIGTKHAVINWTLNSLLNKNAMNKTSFTYKGKTYYLDADQIRRNDELVQAYNQAGVRVTVILLLPKDVTSTGTLSMQFGGEATTKYSSFKTTTKAGCNAFEGIMTYLSRRYGTKENLVCGWIVGNEVNAANIWNYGGNKNLDTYMDNYARAFRICHNAVKSVNKNAKVYISLDHNWNIDPDGKNNRYFSSKATLDTFYKKIKAQGVISFQIAYHAYPQGMKDPVFWDDSGATNSSKTKIINFKNIKVLTDYAKKNFGKDCTIMLSEQSFNSTRGDAVQAAAYAYAYYICEGNSMIEAFIYGREFDHPEEMREGYHWGLCNQWHQKRLIWSVFQYIDTKDSLKFTEPLLKYTNIKKWSKIKGYKKSVFTKMDSLFKQAAITEVKSASATALTLTWDKLNTGDGYEIFRNGVLVNSIAGNSTVSYKDEGLMPGGTYQYQVRMYKEAPDPNDANGRVRLYGKLSVPAAATVTTGRVELNEEKCKVTGNKIKIVWKKMTDVSGFEIVRSTEENGIYTSIGMAAGDAVSFTDKETWSGTIYYYKVRAYLDVAGIRLYGEYSSVIGEQAMIQLTAEMVGDEIVLNWTQWQDAATYRVYCTEESENNFVRQKTLSSYTYSKNKYKNTQDVWQSFASGKTYLFRVRADFLNGTYSKYSNVVSVTIP